MQYYREELSSSMEHNTVVAEWVGNTQSISVSFCQWVFRVVTKRHTEPVQKLILKLYRRPLYTLRHVEWKLTAEDGHFHPMDTS